MSLDKESLNALRIDRTQPRRSSAGIWLLLVLLLLALTGGAAFWWTQRSKAIPVRTILVQEKVTGGQKTLLNASGYVTARRQATVSSKVTGKVIEVKLEEGMRVEADQILARLDASNIETSLMLTEARLNSAQKSLLETQANLKQAEREFKRYSELASQKVSSQSELDRAETDVQTLQARLARQQADITVAEKEVTVWKQQMQDTIIRAPFAGIVTSKNAQPGEMISPVSAGGGFTRTGIGTIVDMSSLEVEVDVNESYINRVQSGQSVEATLDSYPQVHFPANVIAIIPTADRQKATVKVRVGFKQLDPRILPDMGVKVAFHSSGEGTPVTRHFSLPTSAVRRAEGKDVVWLVRDGKLERRAVTAGIQRGEEVTITAGLTGGEKVVVEGPESLAEGAKVTEKKS